MSQLRDKLRQMGGMAAKDPFQRFLPPNGTEMDYAEFIKYVNITKEDIYRGTLEENRERIRVKKEATVIKNLEKISIK